MGGGDGCRYVGIDLSWLRSWNCCAWGLGAQYCIGRIDLENCTLVTCDSFLGSQCVVGGDLCRYFGVGVSLGRVMVLRSSLRRIFTSILIGLVRPDCLVSFVLHFD